MKTSAQRQFQASKLAIVLSLILLPLSAQSQTLEQAVAHTLDTNPDLRVAFNRFKAREEQVNQAIAGYMPTIDINGGYGYEQTDSVSTRRRLDLQNGINGSDGTNELERGEFGVSLKQMLFDGFYTSSEVDRYSFEASADQWALLAAAEDMALDVSKVYLNYLRADQVLKLAEKNLTSHKNIYDQIKQRTDSGLGSIADLSQITGRLARANANVISARNNLLDAKAQYIKLVEIAPTDLVLPVPDADMLPKDLNTGLSMAQENHPILKSASNDINAAEHERSSAQANYYPKVTLELNGNWDNDLAGEDGYSAIASQNVGGYNNDLVAMVRVKYNLFSGGKDLAREKETAYKLGEAKEIRQRAQREVVEGVNLAWNAYEMLSPQKEYIRAHVIASKDTQTAYAQQFNLGQRSLLDLLDTENELFEARKDYLQTEYDEITAKYRVLNATGQLLDSMRVTRPEAWRGERNYEGGANK